MFGVVSIIPRDLDENCLLLGCYAVGTGDSLQTFRDKLFLEVWPDIFTETSVRNYHYLPRKKNTKAQFS
jgi:hypothetical protein